MRKRIFGLVLMFTMISGLALANGSLYRDISTDHWAYRSIKALSEWGIIKGFEDGTFRPNQYVTRAELSQILYHQQELFKQELSKVKTEENHMIQSVTNAIPSVAVVTTNLNQGAGFFIDSTHLLTAQHVVEDEKKVKIKTFAGDSFMGDVTAVNKERDLAIVSFHFAEEIKSIPLGAAYSVGQTVMAIGHPIGLTYSVSKGIISSADRGYEGHRYLQFDSQINSGNSGGPLIDANGKVVGMVVQKMLEFNRKDQKETLNGLGFAVRVEEIRDFLKENGLNQ